MNWLAQNWIWFALAGGAFFIMSRGGGCGMGHSGHRHETKDDTGQPTKAESVPATAPAKPQERHRHGCC